MHATYPYGFWPSTISASMLTTNTVRLSEPQSLNNEVFWLETRPNEKGRNALVQLLANGERRDVLMEPHSIRTRAHEYGGGSYLVTEHYIFCVLDADQSIYKIDNKTHAITRLTIDGEYRYADFCWDKNRSSLICIRENHQHSKLNSYNRIEEKNEIVSINIKGDVTILCSGADFYSNPRLNPKGNKLSYLSWNHPQMPWDGSECYCVDLNNDGEVSKPELIAGSNHESIFQPQWSPDGELFFVSDCNNWWNIYRYNKETKTSEIIYDMNAEFATPQWVFGMSTYGFINSNEIFCSYSQHGQWNLAIIDIFKKILTKITAEYTDINDIFCEKNTAYFIAASATHFSQLFKYKANETSIIAKSSEARIANTETSIAKSLSFPTTTLYKHQNPETVHAFFYEPKSSTISAPKNTLPPLIVMCHGGPTGATETSLNLKIQFWTNRGFAVLDVNYRGSTGYGRQYRDRLKNNWGVTDVIDVCSGVEYLVSKNLIDKTKIVIRGSSAGGFTVLAALTFSDIFTAGASLYGIGDLEALAKDTHKFESHYLDSLIGKYPDEKNIYISRSPIHHIEKLNCPVIFLQGMQDKVVPPNQAKDMALALTAKGIYNEHITYENEGHGFRQAENIQHAIEAELAFYQSIFLNLTGQTNE